MVPLGLLEGFKERSITVGEAQKAEIVEEGQNQEGVNHLSLEKTFHFFWV